MVSDWKKVAEEMLAGDTLGSQVSRKEAWQRACKRIADLEVKLAETKTDLRNALALLRYCFDGDDIPVIFTAEELREWVKGDSGQASLAAAREGESE